LALLCRDYGYHVGPVGEDIRDFPKVTRDGLRAYAEKIGQKPLFLFPEERRKSSGIAAGQVNKLDPEDFVRKLRIFYESDLEIKIQLPGKPAVSYNQGALGFHRSNGKVWNDFLLILQKPDDPTYDCGRAHGLAYVDKSKLQRKQSYDVGQKRLAAMNAKLIAFFIKEYGIQFPKDYKIYEHLPNDPPGIYRFKFLVGGRKDDYSDEGKNERD
jgi:hypothetical protein